MSVLSAAQSAAVRLIGQRPPTIFGASDTFALEMQDLLNETAADIAQYQDWRKMILRATINGDGTTTAFPFPPDFKQMILTGEMHPSMWPTWRHQQIVDLDRWEDLLRVGVVVSPGYWTILNNVLNFDPAIPAGESVTYFYVSRYYASEPNGVPKSEFNQDSDVFVLEPPGQERMLTLGLVWRWRSQKRLEYAEDMANYQKALTEYASRDRGPLVFSVGRPNWANNAGWPVTDWW